MGIKTLDNFRRRYRLLIILIIAALCVGCLELSNITRRSLFYGCVLIAAGMLVRLWTNGIILKSKEVCRVGPYSLCRHPMYLGTAIASIGVAVFLNNPYFIVIILAAVIISFIRAKSEEAKLAERFPEYTAYRNEIPALPTPISLFSSVKSGDILHRTSLRLSYENGEVTRVNLYYLICVASLAYLELRSKLNIGGDKAMYFRALFVGLFLLAAASYLVFPSITKYSRLFFIFCMAAACTMYFVLENS